jgi:hypothetical protein
MSSLPDVSPDFTTSVCIHTKLSGTGRISMQFVISSCKHDPFFFSTDALIMTLLLKEEGLRRRSGFGEVDGVESMEYLEALLHDMSGLFLWAVPELLQPLVLEQTDVEAVPLLTRTAFFRLSPQTRMKPSLNFEDIRL